MHVDEQQILNLSKELWASQLGLSILPGGTSTAEPNGVEKTWASCVRVSGAWQGAILLECPESIARHAAAVLFSADGEAASEDDIQDALKELAEMIGRRMRPLLPEASKLSRPSILVDRGASDTLSGMHDLSELNLTCEGRPVRIVLLEGEPDLAPAD